MAFFVLTVPTVDNLVLTLPLKSRLTYIDRIAKWHFLARLKFYPRLRYLANRFKSKIEFLVLPSHQNPASVSVSPSSTRLIINPSSGPVNSTPEMYLSMSQICLLLSHLQGSHCLLPRITAVVSYLVSLLAVLLPTVQSKHRSHSDLLKTWIQSLLPHTSFSPIHGHTLTPSKGPPGWQQFRCFTCLCRALRALVRAVPLFSELIHLPLSLLQPHWLPFRSSVPPAHFHLPAFAVAVPFAWTASPRKPSLSHSCHLGLSLKCHLLGKDFSDHSV